MSNLRIKTLRRLTEKEFFKDDIYERISKLSNVKYIGFTMERKTKKTEYFNFHFIVEGKKHKILGRPKYLQIIQIPITDKFKKFYRLYDEQSVKVFSNDPSFKYFMCYALAKKKAVIVNSATKKFLGRALIEPPRKTNPQLKLMLNKHMYYMLGFLANDNIDKFLSKKYYLDKDKFNDLWRYTQNSLKRFERL
jgi:hypothetical protein